MGNPMIVVVGAGPGVSGSVARRFAREGYDVTLVGLDEQALEELTGSLGAGDVDVRWSTADVTDEAALSAAVRAAGERAGRIDVLHFNPSAFRQADPLHLTVADLLADVAVGVGALLTAVQAAGPYLRPGSRITVTGSMAADEPWNQAASLGVQKAGVRNLVRSIDTTLRPSGVRAVSVTVRGALSADGPFTPDRVAEAIHAAAQQDEAIWRSEVPYAG